MNNLILILIILINLIEPFMVIEFNNGLVFIKPENLSKTELVEKFKKLSSSKTLKEIKNVIIFMNKIALFAILIKYLGKIKIMRIIFRIINYISLTTFGILITDIYGLKEIIAQIEYY